jgi:hypothetical protein
MVAMVLSMWARQCLVIVARLDIAASSARRISERLRFLSPRGNLSRPLGQRHDASMDLEDLSVTLTVSIEDLTEPGGEMRTHL